MTSPRQGLVEPLLGEAATMSDPKRASMNSVLADLSPFVWSDSEAVQYKVALDTINQVIAWYSARIAEEQDKAVSDQAAIDSWVEARRLAGLAHDALHPGDHAAVTRTHAEYSAALRRLSGRADA
jgi:hypothetical protein